MEDIFIRPLLTTELCSHECGPFLSDISQISHIYSSSCDVNEVQAQQKREMIKFLVYLDVGGGLFLLYGSLFGQHRARGVVGGGRQPKSKVWVLVPFCRTALSVR